MTKAISIVIPTVNFSHYLDYAIQSAIECGIQDSEIVVHINNTSESDFENSKFWKSEEVKWCGGCYYNIMPMDESITTALDHASGPWLFLLSDDDMICDNFLEGIDLKYLSSNSLYMTHVSIIDEYNKITRTSKSLFSDVKVISRDQGMDWFFNRLLHNHLSLFVFSRTLYDKVGPYRIVGYPNGYYMDTVMHGKFIANCDEIYGSKMQVVLRRESSFQGSSKFYFKGVNSYFEAIVDNLFSDEEFKNNVILRYRNRKRFKKKMIQDRFKTEWSKLNKSIYNNNISRKIAFLWYYTMSWNTGIIYKISSLMYIVFYRFKNLVPSSVKKKAEIS
ncbi:hypothetical protein [Ekhidna sp.]|uniref:hypothetical protein n=1 Tax=Ekhidna sp. TaxID=2608089 RepID=UPI003B508662